MEEAQHTPQDSTLLHLKVTLEKEEQIGECINEPVQQISFPRSQQELFSHPFSEFLQQTI
jgi:hypothetical protein